MKKIIVTVALAIIAQLGIAQFKIDYKPESQPTGNMQYFVPENGNQFVGDCIPYYHDGIYYLFWLLDEGHHSSLNGLGAHQWVVSTTSDLKNWKHHPIAIGIDEDWEKSICTGSLAFDGTKFYAFYATRLIDENGHVNEQLSYATSDDCISFEKQKPNPFYTSAPGYSKRDFRDPKVVIDDDGLFHLFVSSWREKNTSIDENQGCLVHLTSSDLKTWNVNKPILDGQRHVPECPDYFKWNDWYYLLYSQAGRTFYVMSKEPYGPWIEPSFQVFDEDWSNVVKTAEFTNGRRIAASWIPSKRDNKDNGGEIFGGAVLLREVIQMADGTLATCFPKETMPEVGSKMKVDFQLDENASKDSADEYIIDALGSIGSFHAGDIPVNCRIKFEVDPDGNNENIGLYLRSKEKASEGYKLDFSEINQTVSLYNTNIQAVDGLDKPYTVEIIMKDDMIDVCVAGKRCIVNRLPERKGNVLWFYAKHGKVAFKDIEITPISE
ncbi:family 43 glycosylhydrolase [Sunxiuqinia sp. A32]|uniref:family 43 glycosylhydrolase n=1 Tax=Sunxiuqinia sp. A32 TaxID=3461496 RepID=UPI004045978A